MRLHEEPRMSVMRGPRVVFVVLAIIAAMALAGFARFEIRVDAGASEIDERARVRLIPTGVIPRIEADADLRLRQTEFRATAFVEGDGLIEGVFYSMWLADQEGNVLFLDAVEAEEVCVIDLVTGEEECEVFVDLEDDRAQAPFNVTSLEGLTINIREHFFRGGVGGFAPVVLTGTVTAADLNFLLVLALTIGDASALAFSSGSGEEFDVTVTNLTRGQQFTQDKTGQRGRSQTRPPGFSRRACRSETSPTGEVGSVLKSEWSCTEKASEPHSPKCPRNQGRA